MAIADYITAIADHLVCPCCHERLVITGDKIECPKSGFHGTIRDGVAMMIPSLRPSFFDNKYETMANGHEREGEWSLCYAQQTALLTDALRPGQVVLDVGCGPILPYHKPAGVFVIGLEPSFHSIRANHEVDLRVYGSAENIPMASASADIVTCFYSIHHMVGATIQKTQANVGRAFREFGRVLKPGGQLFVFEMTPSILFGWSQTLYWNPLRRLFPHVLDMYFWSAAAIIDLGRRALPAGSQVEKVVFRTSVFTYFPPAFSLPWLRVPRLIYPLDAKLYKWRMPRDPV